VIIRIIATLFAVFIALFADAFSPPASAGDLPIVLQIALEEADEAFFDGDYEEALRRLGRAEAWVENINNRGLIITSGNDYQLVECFIFCLRAQVGCAMGDHKEAMSDIRAAERRLKDRRTYYIKRGGVTAEMWLLEAFLSFTKGDASVPVPDFGIAEDGIINPLLANKIEDISSPAQAIKHYERAATILNKPHAQGDSYLYERLSIRLLVAMAKILMLKQGLPSHGDVREAESYLIRAEERSAANPLFELFIAPNAPFPTSYSDFMQHGKDKLKSTGAGENAKLPEADLLNVKRYYHQALTDWLNVQMVRAEVASASETQENQYGWEPQTAERSFRRLESVCEKQFKGNVQHPVYGQISIARGNVFLRNGIRWRGEIARRIEKKKPEDRELSARMLSYLRDACFEAERMECFVESSELGKRTALHEKMLASARIVELRGLSILVESCGHLGDLMSADERDAAEARCKVLQQRLEAMKLFGAAKEEP